MSDLEGGKLGDKFRRALKPDAQAFDEIKFITVPRYKTSGMSGDEWRISIKMEFWRKGRLIHTEDFAGHDMEKAMTFASHKYARACDDAKGFYAGEEDFCDQEGCPEKATVTYRLKEEYCNQGKPHEIEFQEQRRMFCEKHKTRGDCGLEDADRNYEEIKEAN